MIVSGNSENYSLQAASPEQELLMKKEEILAEVRTRFRRSPYHELRNVVCDFDEGVLTMQGNVPSCFLKQIAQSMVFSMERIETIDNRLEIIDS
jgi:hypothetical protein